MILRRAVLETEPPFLFPTVQIIPKLPAARRRYGNDLVAPALRAEQARARRMTPNRVNDPRDEQEQPQGNLNRETTRPLKDVRINGATRLANLPVNRHEPRRVVDDRRVIVHAW
jgi:hypothetical protein